MSDERPPRTTRELYAIVEADAARLTRIGQVWSYLSDDEQEKLAQLAERLAGPEAVREATE